MRWLCPRCAKAVLLLETINADNTRAVYVYRCPVCGFTLRIEGWLLPSKPYRC